MNLEYQVKKYCEENNISGVLRVTLKDKIIHSQSFGFADFENKIPLDEKSMFTLYSLSKPFCAIGLMKLYDKGLMNLDVHPGEYVPEAQGFDDRVTIRHLLHHISGLPDFEQNKNFSSKYKTGYPEDIRDHLKKLAEFPSYFIPGTEGKYANINFVLCALVIENITGISYADYMKKEVFEPFGMNDAVVDKPQKVILNRVKGYELINSVMTQVEKSHNWMFGAGDIVATVEDVYCLNKAIKHRLVLSNDVWAELLSPTSVNGMGMGCTVSQWHGKKRITHNGGHIGFRTLHIQLPEDDFDIILLSNSGFGEARTDISEMVYNEIYGNEMKTVETFEMDKGYI